MKRPPRTSVSLSKSDMPGCKGPDLDCEGADPDFGGPDTDCEGRSDFP